MIREGKTAQPDGLTLSIFSLQPGFVVSHGEGERRRVGACAGSEGACKAWHGMACEVHTLW